MSSLNTRKLCCRDSQPFHNNSIIFYLTTLPVLGINSINKITDVHRAVSRTRTCKGNQSTERKSAPVPLWPPKISHNWAWDQTWAITMRSKRLTTRAMAQSIKSIKTAMSVRGGPRLIQLLHCNLQDLLCLSELPYFCIFLKLTRNIGTLFSFVHWMRKETRLHQALVSLNHDGSSNNSVNTVSSSSKLDSSPSPLKVLRLILSADKFLVNLQHKYKRHIREWPSLNVSNDKTVNIQQFMHII
jgi:hypothetical protein